MNETLQVSEETGSLGRKDHSTGKAELPTPQPSAAGSMVNASGLRSLQGPSSEIASSAAN